MAIALEATAIVGSCLLYEFVGNYSSNSCGCCGGSTRVQWLTRLGVGTVVEWLEANIYKYGFQVSVSPTTLDDNRISMN